MTIVQKYNFIPMCEIALWFYYHLVLKVTIQTLIYTFAAVAFLKLFITLKITYKRESPPFKCPSAPERHKKMMFAQSLRKKTSYKFAREIRGAAILPPRMSPRAKELLRNDRGQKKDLDAVPGRITARWCKYPTVVIVRKILLCPQDMSQATNVSGSSFHNHL